MIVTGALLPIHVVALLVHVSRECCVELTGSGWAAKSGPLPWAAVEVAAVDSAVGESASASASATSEWVCAVSVSSWLSFCACSVLSHRCTRSLSSGSRSLNWSPSARRRSSSSSSSSAWRSCNSAVATCRSCSASWVVICRCWSASWLVIRAWRRWCSSSASSRFRRMVLEDTELLRDSDSECPNRTGGFPCVVRRLLLGIVGSIFVQLNRGFGTMSERMVMFSPKCPGQYTLSQYSGGFFFLLLFRLKERYREMGREKSSLLFWKWRELVMS